MNVHVRTVVTDHEAVTEMSLMNMSRDEVALIWYALDEYKKAVLKTARKSKVHTVEDEAFCFDIAAQCAKAQFEIMSNHDTHLQPLVQTFLDIL